MYTDGGRADRGAQARRRAVLGPGGSGESIEREAAGGQAAPETLRRLRDAIIERRVGSLRDDATAVLREAIIQRQAGSLRDDATVVPVEWRRDTEIALLPQTV